MQELGNNPASPSSRGERTQKNLSKIACYSCRDRKVKCSRELPACSSCRCYQQSCSYPSGLLKPGPKPGTVSKRHNVDHDEPHNSKRGRKRAWTTTAEHSPDQTAHQDSASRSITDSPVSQEVVRQHSVNVYNLIVPSHEESSPESTRVAATPDVPWHDKGQVLMSACYNLGVTPATAKQLIPIFFQSFHSFGLFREPAFYDKLSQIPSVLQATALLASMFAFVSKRAHGEALAELDYCELASEYANNALAECGDDQPPLCLLQALILITHRRVIKGVRGRAWRSLGLCIRVACELGIDSVDVGKDAQSDITDVARWCEDEEQRRAYWAIYEIDIFATIMKQARMMTDWGTKMVYLPVDDEHWFQAQPQKSCFLEADVLQRTKVLQETKNESARAWYVVLNSLVAQSYILGRSGTQRAFSRRDPKRQTSITDSTNSRHQCLILLNSIQLYSLLLPSRFRFCGQRLDFNGQNTNPTKAALPQHGLIYQLAILMEVSRLLALRPFVFDTYVQSLTRTFSGRQDQCPLDTASCSELSPRELQQCFNASDAILNIVSSSSESHYQHVNPYIAHAFWLAATVQLLHQELIKDENEKMVIQSQFEVLKATNDQFVRYWEMSAVPKQNLDELATRLKEFTAASKVRPKNKNMAADQRKSPRNPEWSNAFDQTAVGLTSNDNLHSRCPENAEMPHNGPVVDPGPVDRLISSNPVPRDHPYRTQSQQYRRHQSQSLDTTSGTQTHPILATAPDSAAREATLQIRDETLAYSIAMTDEHDSWLPTAPQGWTEAGQDEHEHNMMGDTVVSDARDWLDFTNHDIDAALSNYLDDMFS